jgi:hypothetical protein
MGRSAANGARHRRWLGLAPRWAAERRGVALHVRPPSHRMLGSESDCCLGEGVWPHGRAFEGWRLVARFPVLASRWTRRLPLRRGMGTLGQGASRAAVDWEGRHARSAHADVAHAATGCAVAVIGGVRPSVDGAPSVRGVAALEGAPRACRANEGGHRVRRLRMQSVVGPRSRATGGSEPARSVAAVGAVPECGGSGGGMAVVNGSVECVGPSGPWRGVFGGRASRARSDGAGCALRGLPGFALGEPEASARTKAEHLVERARGHNARGVDAGGAASGLIGCVAAALARGARLVCRESRGWRSGGWFEAGGEAGQRVSGQARVRGGCAGADGCGVGARGFGLGQRSAESDSGGRRRAARQWPGLGWIRCTAATCGVMGPKSGRVRMRFT